MENLFDPVIRIDVENRCAVMLVYGRHLVVLPFKQENPVDESDQLHTGSVLNVFTFSYFLCSFYLNISRKAQLGYKFDDESNDE